MTEKTRHAAPVVTDDAGSATRFENLLGRVLTVSKTELNKREAAYKKSRRAKKSRTSRP